VATLAGVASNGIGQGGYLLDGFEHLLAYGTIAPGAAGRTFVAALKLIDFATRTDYAVGIGRYVGVLFHCVPLAYIVLGSLIKFCLNHSFFYALCSPYCFAFHPVGCLWV
jgi:hypothetical protein